jgi:phosphoribosylformylglycinamidine synthase subunit PurS
MKYLAAINIMPHKVLLDPQGKAVTSGLKNLGLNTVADVRVGKHITLEIDAPTSEEAHKITEEACKKLLANQVMEYFEFTISEFA